MHRLQADVDVIARIDVVPAILEVICRTTGMGFAAVARVTDTDWVACAVRDEINFGLVPGGELKVETTICSEIRDSGRAVIIDHVAGDEVFCGHPTPELYGFQSYVSVPILRKDGSFFGTLCAIDPKPANLKAKQTLGMFKLYAELISFHLETQERLDISEAALLDERRTAELREQFIAVLGHDLRNPLASIGSGANLLAKADLNEREREILRLVQGSVRRMTGLVENLLDLAGARFGGGLQVSKDTRQPLAPMLQQIIDEARVNWPERQIEASIDVPDPIACDATKIGQLLSNLLGNALTHGADAPVLVHARADGDMLALSVTNQGDPIPKDVAARLFEPFFRAASGSSEKGLGLGLYIASEIAKAHGGALTVTSSPEATRFRFTMPLR